MLDRWQGGKEANAPAVGKLRAHILQVCVAHVVDGKEEQVLVLLDAFADVCE